MDYGVFIEQPVYRVADPGVHFGLELPVGRPVSFIENLSYCGIIFSPTAVITGFDQDNDPISINWLSEPANSGIITQFLADGNVSMDPDGNMDFDDTVTGAIFAQGEQSAPITTEVFFGKLTEGDPPNQGLIATLPHVFQADDLAVNFVNPFDPSFTIHFATIGNPINCVVDEETDQEELRIISGAGACSVDFALKISGASSTISGIATLAFDAAVVTASPDSYVFQKNIQGINFLDVLANDFGGTGALTVTQCSSQIGGSFDPTSDGLGVDFVAQTGISGVGIASALYTVTDTLGATGQGTISVELTNTAPVLAPIPDQAATQFNELQFVANGSDPDGDPITFSLANEPLGAVIDPTTGVFTWTPTATGDFTADVIISDNDASPLTDEQTVNINVSLGLIASDFTTSITKNIASTIDVIPYVSSGAPPYTLWSVSNSNGGIATISNGFVLFTPTTNIEGLGAGTFDYEVTDADGTFSLATCTVDVINTKAIWTVTPTQSVRVFTPFTLSVTATDTDPPLTLEMLSVSPLNSDIEFTDIGDGKGEISGFFSQAGRYAITLRATDEGALTSDVVVTFDAAANIWEERAIDQGTWEERPIIS